jgi:DNA-binding response OmpR family regulator
MKRILIVEDNVALLKGLRDNLEFEGYEVLAAMDGESALAAAREMKPDLIVLDLILPKLGGFDVCRTLRRDGARTPILMLTARGQEADRIKGFEVGADDYVTKPFSVPELLGRIQAILRRTEGAAENGLPDRIRLGRVEIDFRKFEARKDGRLLELSRKEFGVLRHLASRKGEVVGRDELLDRVWGSDKYPTPRTVDNHIALLRAKIEPLPDRPRYLLTFRGIGYKLVLDD